MISGLLLPLGVVLIVALGLVAIKWGAIDLLGALSGGIISFVAFLAGGFAWLLMIIIFFGVSSALTKFRYDYKRALGSAQEKSGKRSWPNSLANGGVSAIAAGAELYTHSNIFAVMFLASVAAALSDTLATEVGLLSHSKPKLITHPSQTVEPGTSGGISILGDSAAVASAFGLTLLGVAVYVLDRSSPQILAMGSLAVALGAIVGVFLDSLLGATLQGSSRCKVCGKLTENPVHHDQETVLVRGYRHLDNNMVNFLGILGGALISVLIYLLMAVI